MTTASIEFFPFGTAVVSEVETRLNALLADRRHLEDALTTTALRIDEGAACDAVQPQLEELNKKAQTGAITNQYSLKLIENLRARHSRIRRTAAQHTNELPRRTSEYNQLLAQIDAMKRKLAETTAAAKATVWTLSDITEMLKEMPNITDIRIIDNAGIVSWTYTGLKMYPSEHPANLTTGSGWGVPLANITVTINLQTGDTHFRGDAEFKHFHDTKVCHPHVMQDYTPCWGSFEYMVADCLEKADLLSLATIVQLFLQQTNVTDTAGKGWPKWLNGMPESIPTKTVTLHDGGYRLYAVLTVEPNSNRVRSTPNWICTDSNHSSMNDIPADTREKLRAEHNVIAFVENTYVLYGRNT